MIPLVRCDVPGWEDRLRDYLKGQVEVDLIEFDFENCGKIAEHLGRQYSMEMTLDRDLAARMAHFRARPRGSSLPPRDGNNLDQSKGEGF